jgi:nitrogen regulatory protein P-II 1
MKKIEAIIPGSKLYLVERLLTQAEVVEMTILQVRKFSYHNRQIQRYRGIAFLINFLTRLKLEVLVEDDQVEWVGAAILEIIQAEEDNSLSISSVEKVKPVQSIAQPTIVLSA